MRAVTLQMRWKAKRLRVEVLCWFRPNAAWNVQNVTMNEVSATGQAAVLECKNHIRSCARSRRVDAYCDVRIRAMSLVLIR
jgi:hypothetical protein